MQLANVSKYCLICCVESTTNNSQQLSRIMLWAKSKSQQFAKINASAKPKDQDESQPLSGMQDSTDFQSIQCSN